MAVAAKDLWSLVLNQQCVDPAELAGAVEEAASRDELDFRTRLLIRDSLAALRRHWGAGRVAVWLGTSPARQRLETIEREDLGAPGFPYLQDQLMEPTTPDTVRQFLRELGEQLHQPQRLYVGGSIALILPGLLARRTQDVDVVDEVPAEIRALGPSLQQLTRRYRLQLAHFQSHYLPQGWEQRLHSLGSFGRLQVFLVDVYDVFLSKLFSGREKDRDDLRAVAPRLDKDTVVRRLRDAAAPLLADASFRDRAAHNWYILYGEPLPL